MRYGLVLIGTIALVTAALGIAADARAQVLDQSQIELSASGDAAVVDDTSLLAQTFTAGLTGQLTRIDAGIFRASATGPDPGLLHVEVRPVSGGFPTDTVLAHETLESSAVAAWIRFGPLAFTSIAFDPSVALTAGQQYAIVAYTTNAGDAYYVWTWSGVFRNPYPGGQVVAKGISPGAPPGAWGATPADLVFRTWIGPKTPRPTPNDPSECKDGGSARLMALSFKNQGQCIAYVNHHNLRGNDNDAPAQNRSDENPSAPARGTRLDKK
jgi:hypothetical protein